MGSKRNLNVSADGEQSSSYQTPNSALLPPPDSKTRKLMSRVGSERSSKH